MAKLSRKKGTTSQIFHVFIQDSSSTTGAGLTGLTYASSGLACKYINAGGTLSGAITLEDITTLGTYQAPTANTNMRFKELNSASPSQGMYEIHVHNDWMNLTGGSLVIMLAGATNMAQFRLEIDLQADVNVTHVAGTVQTAGDIPTMITAVDDFVDTEVAAILAAVDTEVAAIKTTTDQFTFSVANKVDANAMIIGDKTGYALSAAGVQAIWEYTTRTLTAFSAALALSVWDVLESAIATANSIGVKVINNLDAAITSRQPSGNVTVGTNLDKTGYRLVTEIRNGTAQGGGATYITLDSGASTELNFYVGCLVVLPASGQARLITAYNGSTKEATIGPNPGWGNPVPGVGTAFTIIPAGYLQGINNGVTVTTNNDKWGYYLDYDFIGSGTAQGGTINDITLDVFASSIDDFYVGTLIVLLYTGGALSQARLITAYNGSTKVATVAPAWKVAPDATSVFFIKSAGAVNINSNSDITAIKAKTDTIIWTDITDIKNESLGKWSINKSTNVLTMYKADGVTVLKQFNLTDNASVSERVPV